MILFITRRIVQNNKVKEYIMEAKILGSTGIITKYPVLSDYHIILSDSCKLSVDEYELIIYPKG